MTLTRARILAEARGWLGTPYTHQASLKGVGADCLGFIRGLYVALVDDAVGDVPPYSPDWAEASDAETLIDGAHRHLVALPGGDARPGDVLVFRLRPGAPAKHMALASAADRMIHAYDRAAVAETSIGPWWRRRIAACFAFPGVID